MGILKRLLHNENHSRYDDDSSRSEDELRSRMIGGSLRPLSYKKYVPFFFYKGKDIEQKLSSLLGSGSLDDGTGNVLDNEIRDCREKADAFVDKQHILREDTIEMLRIRQEGDLVHINKERELLAVIQPALQKELQDIRERYKDYKFRDGKEASSEK